jgi:hypothetical protein
MSSNAKPILRPSIYQQLLAIILPAPNYVQNSMVSSWLHAFRRGIRYVLLRQASGNHDFSCYSGK